jgi:ubiquinone/menaquinone biosynthesis C-methylase UbiE
MPPRPPETYTPGYGKQVSDFMARRRAATSAAFFLPALRPGMDVLDCGCGPGTVTLGLAQAVAPGRVEGLDLAPGQVALATARAREAGMGNVRFRTGSLYALPYADAAFDAVLAHALLEHLRDPLAALGEARRVLRPGGVVGVRSPDWGGLIVWPTSPPLEDALGAYAALQRRNGGDLYVGRRLGTLLAGAGFTAVRVSAGYECYADPLVIAEYLARRLAEEDGSGHHAAALRAWGEAARPGTAGGVGALFAQAWVQATGRVPGP